MGVIKIKKLKLPFRVCKKQEQIEYKKPLKEDGSEYTLLELMGQASKIISESNIIRKKVIKDYFESENKKFLNEQQASQKT